MQTVWKGSIAFGLVSIPVRLVSATEERDVQLRQVHKADGGRIKYRRFCSVDGEEVPYREIAKGYEL
ncbi:MAG: Ku protein, partial [Actinomycetota bacterium]|nr:Ku protein [Actinomycetota bacterium]